MSDRTRRVVELCHVVRHGMVTYPGLPGPEIVDYLSRESSRASYAPGTEFQIGQITMVANTGTYLDVPFHRFPHGADLAQVPLPRLVDLPGLLVRATEDRRHRGIGRELFEPYDAEVTGRAVLVHTGWDRHWGTDRYGQPSHPYLTAAGVAWLVNRRPALVGIDSVNVDDMADPARPAHTGLLAAGIPIVEHLRGLDALPERGFRFHAPPVAIAGMGTFPVRAYALVED
jgi:kynurenine formamidase